MAPSTPISSRRGLSQGSSSFSGQSLSAILDLDPISPGFTCIGYASSNNNNRCRRKICALDRNVAKSLLNTGVAIGGSPQELEQLLTSLAPRVLCLGYHQDQAPTIVAEWSRLVAAYNDNSQNSPASGERASAIRALPSARNNLSSYARAEPDTPSPAEPSRPQRESKEPDPRSHNNPTSPGARQAGGAGSTRNPHSSILGTSTAVLGRSSTRQGNLGRNARNPRSSGEGSSQTSTATEQVIPFDIERNLSQFESRMSSLLQISEDNLPRLSSSSRVSTRTAGHAETSRTRSTSSRALSSGSSSRSRAAEQSRPSTTSNSTTRSGTATPRPPGRRTHGNDSHPPTLPSSHSLQSAEPTSHPSSITAATYNSGTNPSSTQYYPRVPYYNYQPTARRRPFTGDCSICYEPLTTAPLPWHRGKKNSKHNHSDNDSIDDRLVWCRAECGVNFHKSCFDCWKACCIRLSCPNW